MYRWLLVLLLAAVCQATAAFAQADDVAYCKVLGEIYLAKVMKTDVPTGQVPWAIDRCQAEPASSIVILQKALTDAKVQLPSRQ